jgi:hypothetical protein
VVPKEPPQEQLLELAPTNRAMVKRMIWVSGLLVVVVSGMAAAGTANFANWISDQSSFLATLALPESGALILLGSVLISGASFLRRKWQARREEEL